jgi:hypothetical protein
MRSLDRRSMYGIFAPLDPDEALPRELVLEGRRHRSVGRRELAGALWLPALFLILWGADWGRVGALMAVGAIVMAFIALAVFAVSDRR